MSLPQPLGHVLAVGCWYQRELLALQGPQSGWDGHSGHQPCRGGCLVRGSALRVLPWVSSGQGQQQWLSWGSPGRVCS